MNLTPEQLKQNAAAMIAFADGKPIQWQTTSGEWMTWGKFAEIPNWNLHILRPAPGPKLAPWDAPEDVPEPVCYLRRKGATGCTAITHFNDDGLTIISRYPYREKPYNLVVTWGDLKDWEYSTDRVTWKPCTKEVK